MTLGAKKIDLKNPLIEIYRLHVSACLSGNGKGDFLVVPVWWVVGGVVFPVGSVGVWIRQSESPVGTALALEIYRDKKKQAFFRTVCIAHPLHSLITMAAYAVSTLMVKINITVQTRGQTDIWNLPIGAQENFVEVSCPLLNRDKKCFFTAPTVNAAWLKASALVRLGWGKGQSSNQRNGAAQLSASL